MDKKRFEIDYSPFADAISLNDKLEKCIIVLTKEQLENLLEWYCEEFGKIVI